MNFERAAFFLDTPTGGRFCLVTRPSGSPRGALLYLHPFAEEMNKSRRMAALAAQTFAEKGWLVLQMDFFGCGDSAGDFADATWNGWLSDIDLGWGWLSDELVREKLNGPRVLWTLRAGSLLAADWMRNREESPPLIMWQPVINGKQHLTQFLRLKAANEMLMESDARLAMAAARDDLQAGRPVEVGGYELSPALAGGLSNAHLVLPVQNRSTRVMLEVSASEDLRLSPAVSKLDERWAADGVSVESEVVFGSAFWQTLEIETVPALIERTAAHLEKLSCGST